jgi:hypothetical protein
MPDNLKAISTDISRFALGTGVLYAVLGLCGHYRLLVSSIPATRCGWQPRSSTKGFFVFGDISLGLIFFGCGVFKAVAIQPCRGHRTAGPRPVPAASKPMGV